MKALSIAILGCGSRGRTYARIASSLGDRYEITAATDIVPGRTATVAGLSKPGVTQTFASADEFFAAGKLAEVLIIATQDADHVGHATAALHAGYDILLEKPAADSREDCEALDELARTLGRRIALCFVLRYSPFYATVKHFIESGRLGKIITLSATEGVEPFHQGHSFVRGHWAKKSNSTPMIVAKCSHDADLICWLTDSSPRSVSSIGKLSWFRAENAPQGAPPRCTDGCPAAGSCMYDAHRYLTDKRRWLAMVMDGADVADDAQIHDFLHTSPWGRCVYQCDNDVVDHQIVTTELENGITASLVMTAFDQGRAIEIHGTLGSLRGGDPAHAAGAPELWFREHATETLEPIPVEKTGNDGYAGHGGGDFGLIQALESLFSGPDSLPPGLDGLAGHRLAYLAEDSRVAGGQLVTPALAAR